MGGDLISIRKKSVNFSLSSRLRDIHEYINSSLNLDDKEKFTDFFLIDIKTPRLLHFEALEQTIQKCEGQLSNHSQTELHRGVLTPFTEQVIYECSTKNYMDIGLVNLLACSYEPPLTSNNNWHMFFNHFSCTLNLSSKTLNVRIFLQVSV